MMYWSIVNLVQNDQILQVIMLKIEIFRICTRHHKKTI